MNSTISFVFHKISLIKSVVNHIANNHTQVYANSEVAIN